MSRGVAQADARARTARLLREVVSVSSTEDGSAVDLVVRTVGYSELAVPGILTTESAADQGLDRRLPNAPSIGPAVAPATGALARVRLRAPAPDVLRMTVIAAAGGGPYSDDDGRDDGILVDPAPQLTALGVSEDDEVVRVATTELSFVVRRRPFAFHLEDANRRVLVRSGGDRRQVAGLPLVPHLALAADSATVSLERSPGEHVLGLGEQFGPVVHDGGRFELVADDALGSGTGMVYKAAPVWHSTAGYTVFLHTPGPATVDVGARYPSVLEASVEEPRLDAFLLVGSLKRRLARYCDLTGRMRVPPRWAFGVWMSRCRYRSRAELENVASELRRRGIGCDVLHIDPDWLERDLLNCDFVWSEEKYPDPEEMLAGLHDQGFRVSLWELPYLDPESPVAKDAEQQGLLVRTADGSPAAVARTLSRDGRPRWLVDFSREEARAWWREGNAGLVDLGVDVVKCDFGEGLPDDAVMGDGRSGRSWRNLYPLWYSRTVSELLADRSGRAPLVWSRSGWAGSQRYPAQWGGDAESSVAGLAASVRAGLSWALSAPGLWGHDIGGFYGDGPTPGLYVRWAQAGCLSPMARFHGLGPREPWAFGPEAERIVTAAIELRYRLLPYVLSVAYRSSAEGLPLMRPLVLEHPHDPDLARVEHEFLLGEDLLVVAVLDDGPGPARTPVVLPPGGWYEWFTGELRQGPCRFEMDVPLDRFPLFVRAGSVIPMGPHGRCTAEIPDHVWELHVVAGAAADMRVSEVHDRDGVFRYRPVRGPTGEIVAVEAQEPAPRAQAAVLHLEGGRCADLALRS